MNDEDFKIPPPRYEAYPRLCRCSREDAGGEADGLEPVADIRAEPSWPQAAVLGVAFGLVAGLLILTVLAMVAGLWIL